MTIADVSKKYDITADTLRYYERIGLLPPVHRNGSGNRDYTEEDCNWVSFIKCMRRAGLSIEALIEYVSLFNKGESTVAARKALLIEEREGLAARVGEMQQTLSYLDQKIEHYDDMMTRCENKLKKREKTKEK